MSKESFILLVEDNEIDALIATKMIQSIDPEIKLTQAINGKEAIKFLENNPENLPWVIFLDLIMPLMDGFEFLKKVTEYPQWKNIPIVVLTTSVNPNDKKRVEELYNIKLFLQKPFNGQMFQDVVNQIKQTMAK